VTSLPLRSHAGADLGTIEADSLWFGLEPNIPVMHQVVVAQLAARRAGTQSTKTRAEISRSGAKSRRQKGGGTSRQGSMRAPQWVGGGVALGPKPRSYAQRTPKKMINLALRCALSDRATAGHVIVVDAWSFATPKTKEGIASLSAMNIDGKTLMVLDAASESDFTAAKSFGNLPDVQLIKASELNAYDVLKCDYVVFTKGTLPGAADGASNGSQEATR
jgi:large subunit ribosomal protein L4